MVMEDLLLFEDVLYFIVGTGCSAELISYFSLGTTFELVHEDVERGCSIDEKCSRVGLYGTECSEGWAWCIRSAIQVQIVAAGRENLQ